MAFQDFDLIHNRRQEERKQKIRRRITYGVTSGLALLLVVGAAIGTITYKNGSSASSSDHNDNNSAAPKTANIAIKSVKTVCAATDYKHTCEDSLTKAVNNSTSLQPKDLIRLAFTVASEEIDKAITKAKQITFDTPKKKAAFDDCLTLLADAKDELNISISTVQGKDLHKLPSRTPDINNWLSAVLSYQQTCIDGFPDGKEKDAVKKTLTNFRELGSNALAIVSQLSSLLSSFQIPDVKRSLLAVDEGGFPAWMDHEERRMLKSDSKIWVPNMIVAKDGSGNFTAVNDALNAMPKTYKGRYLIYIKEGVYDETVIVTKKMVNVTMYGDGSQKSIITGSKNYVDGTPTFQTATFAALGEGFMAQSLGFRNTAGPEKHQAVALRVQADRSIFVNCRMEGYQDTLYAQTHRQFYRSCYITGTVDFIFGDAAAIFQNCNIYVRKPMDNQQNIVTAQGRIDRRQTSGIVLHNCKILADDTLEPVKAQFKSYLGRPWKEYSRTIVMESEIGDLIHPQGWMEWSGTFALKTLYYAEYNNKGPGASTAARVNWPGYKKEIKRDEAMKFTVGPFLQGETWLKNPDVPVRFGMFS